MEYNTTSHESQSTVQQQQQYMIRAAKEGIDVGEPIAAEMQTLAAQLETRFKTAGLAHIGLPRLQRSLDREIETLQDVLEELGDGGKPEPDLKKLTGRWGNATAFVKRMAIEWSILKRCEWLVGVNQTFYVNTKQRSGRPSTSTKKKGESTRGHNLDGATSVDSEIEGPGQAEVHVVHGGAEWINIQGLSVDRLGRQMTEAGWDWGEHDEDESDDEPSSSARDRPFIKVDRDEWESAILAQTLRRLVFVARHNRHDYVFPRIRLVLPNIDRFKAGHDIRLFLEQLEGNNLDPNVFVTVDDASSKFLTTPPPEDLDVVVSNLVGGSNDWSRRNLTHTLNIDQGILIDLISEIVHSRIRPQPWHDNSTRVQVTEENEGEGGVMTRALYPILRGHRLVCTVETAEHFHYVLQTVGTDRERQRGRLLVPLGSTSDNSGKDTQPGTESDPGAAHAEYASLSIHPTPPDLQIPVTILPERWLSDGAASVDAAISAGRLPAVAAGVAQRIAKERKKTGKLSTYMQGWADGVDTITSNKEIRSQMHTWFEANRTREDETGPRVYCVGASRALLSRNCRPPEGWTGDEVEDQATLAQYTEEE